MRALDTAGAARVDDMLHGNAEAVEALQAIRTEFNDHAYRESLVARLRNGIGFHYRDETIRQLVTGFDEESVLESTAAQVGGLARVADPLVKIIMDGLVGGDFTADERHSREVSKWLTTVGHLLTFVDHLFNVLLGRVPESIVSTSHAVIDVPIGVQQARAAVERDRRAAGSGEPPAQ